MIQTKIDSLGEYRRAAYNQTRNLAINIDNHVHAVKCQIEDQTTAILEAIESMEEPDEQLHRALSEQYIESMSALQAAKERFIEGVAHLRSAVTLNSRVQHIMHNVSTCDFDGKLNI